MSRPARKLPEAMKFWEKALPSGTQKLAGPLLNEERAAGIKARTGQDARAKLCIERRRLGFGGPFIFERAAAPPAPTRPVTRISNDRRTAETSVPGKPDKFTSNRREGESYSDFRDRHSRTVRFLAYTRPRLLAGRGGAR